MKYKKVNSKNLKELYSNLKGNLYYKERDGYFWVVNGFTEEDLQNGLNNNIELIWIKGPALNPFVLKERK